MKIRLSYTLSQNTPLYQGTPSLKIEPVHSIARGDSANTSEIRFSSHTGTHIDVPNHFCPEGASVAEFLGEENVFFPAILVDIPSKKTMIDVIDLSIVEQYPEAEAVLVHTGMEKLRQMKPDTFITEYPFISQDIPDYLRKTCPDIRLFGTDTISISHPENRAAGRACHRNFLCKKPAILILEDMNLSNPFLKINPFSVDVYPIVLNSPDGTPVIVFADIPRK